MKVLILEDSKTYRAFLMDSFERIKNHWDVSFCETIDAAIKLIEAESQDIMILDWFIGSSTSQSVLDLLKGAEIFPPVVLIMTSAKSIQLRNLEEVTIVLVSSSDDDPKMSKELGLLVKRKPYDFDEFSALMDSIEDIAVKKLESQMSEDELMESSSFEVSSDDADEFRSLLKRLSDKTSRTREMTVRFSGECKSVKIESGKFQRRSLNG